MKKWVCTVCGYVYEGEQAPESVLPVEFRLPSLKSRQARVWLGRASTRLA